MCFQADAGFFLESASQSGQDAGGDKSIQQILGGGNVDRSSGAMTDRPILMIKTRAAEALRPSVSNHVLSNIPGLLAGDGALQTQLHHVQSSVQVSSTPR